MKNFWTTQRESLGLSQRGMAQVLGIANQTVSRWEADERIPTLPIKLLAEKYQATERQIERALIDQRKRIEGRAETAVSK